MLPPAVPTPPPLLEDPDRHRSGGTGVQFLCTQPAIPLRTGPPSPTCTDAEPDFPGGVPAWIPPPVAPAAGACFNFDGGELAFAPAMESSACFLGSRRKRSSPLATRRANSSVVKIWSPPKPRSAITGSPVARMIGEASATLGTATRKRASPRLFKRYVTSLGSACAPPSPTCLALEFDLGPGSPNMCGPA